MKVNNFRFLTTVDEFDSRYEDWSRAYEHPVVIKTTKEE